MKNENEKALIEEVDFLKSQIKRLKERAKYGLVWDSEKEPEDVVIECQSKLPILKDIKTKEINSKSSENCNILIEGDNYQALQVLNYTHKGKFDVIYIDPPYNTGAKSWRYNNNYVDKEDIYRHSKFLNFLNARLKLCKNLLSPRGIFICAIDDYEAHNVRHLLDDLFREDNRLGTVVVVHNPRGRNDDKFFATMHEYMLIYARDKNLVNIKHFELNEDEINKYNKNDGLSAYNETSFMRTGNNSNRKERPNLFYSIFYNPETNKLSLDKNSKSVELLPINEAREEKTWRWGKDTFLEKCKTELLVRKVKDKFRIFKKRRITNIAGRKPKTVWHGPKYDSSTYGIMVLQDMLGRNNAFPYPKSINLMKDILGITTEKDSLVLDFFAGSGTTGHAILELNEEDDGQRKFILCTNNENNICEDICYPRVKKVIEGYTNSDGKTVDGLGTSLKYFRTSTVDVEHINKVSDENRVKLTYQAGEMIALKENTFDDVDKNDWWQIFTNGKKYTAIYFKEDKTKLYELVEKLSKYKEKIALYIFSWGKNEYKNEFAEYKNIKVLDIPEPIIEVYKGINRL